MLINADELEFLNKALSKAEGKITRKQAKDIHDPKSLPPGGVWRTIRGHHVYIVNGKVAAGSLPWVNKKGEVKAKKATKAHLKEYQKHIDAEAKKKAKDEPKEAKPKKTKAKTTKKKTTEVKKTTKRKDLYHLSYEELKKNPPTLDEAVAHVTKWYKDRKDDYGDKWEDKAEMKKLGEYMLRKWNDLANDPRQDLVAHAIEDRKEKIPDFSPFHHANHVHALVKLGAKVKEAVEKPKKKTTEVKKPTKKKAEPKAVEEKIAQLSENDSAARAIARQSPRLAYLKQHYNSLLPNKKLKELIDSAKTTSELNNILEHLNHFSTIHDKKDYKRAIAHYEDVLRSEQMKQKQGNPLHNVVGAERDLQFIKDHPEFVDLPPELKEHFHPAKRKQVLKEAMEYAKNMRKQEAEKSVLLYILV